MIREHQSTRGLLSIAGIAILASLALGAICAGTAQAQSWYIGGKAFTGEETYASSGTFKAEIPSMSATFSCTETGSGVISGSVYFKGEMTLKNCVLVGVESCKFEPVTYKYSGDTSSFWLEVGFLIFNNTSETCPWYPSTKLTETTAFLQEFAAESVKQSVTSSAKGSFGSHLVYFSGSSSWELTGLNALKAWGPVGPPAFVFAFGSKGTKEGQLSGNEGVAIDSYGNVWVVDKGNNRIQKFGPKGNWLLSAGSFGTGKGQFNQPTDIAFDPTTTNVLVTDSGNNRVERFTSSGVYINQFGIPGTGFKTEFNDPEGITVDSGGNVWVVDTGNNRVQEFNYNGERLAGFGSTGKGNGLLKHPTDLAVTSEFIWVTDTENNRVEKFELEGGYEGKFGVEGAGNGQFKGPRGITVDAVGNLWVVDRGNRRVQGFDSSGAYLNQFGKEGTGSGQFGSEVSYIAADAGKGLWVSDGSNFRVQKWWR